MKVTNLLNVLVIGVGGGGGGDLNFFAEVVNYLVAFGHRAELAVTSAEGISMALQARGQFELIITGHSPVEEVNGHEVLRRILVAFPSTKIWFLEINRERENYEEAERLGAEKTLECQDLQTLLRAMKLCEVTS